MNLTPRVRDMIAQALATGRVNGVPHPFERDPQGLFMCFDEIQIASAPQGATLQFFCGGVPLASMNVRGSVWPEHHVIKLVDLDARIKIEVT